MIKKKWLKKLVKKKIGLLIILCCHKLTDLVFEKVQNVGGF